MEYSVKKDEKLKESMRNEEIVIESEDVMGDL